MQRHKVDCQIQERVGYSETIVHGADVDTMVVFCRIPRRIYRVALKEPDEHNNNEPEETKCADDVDCDTKAANIKDAFVEQENGHFDCSDGEGVEQHGSE